MEAMAAERPDDLGLRASKKARTRRAISDIATRLFIERGFDTVSVAEVAAAADVSVKTVFNYFGSKEDLFFDRAEEVIAGLERAVDEREPGIGPLGALRRLLTANLHPFAGMGWRPLQDPAAYEEIRAFVAAEDASPVLRARRLTLADEWHARLTACLGDRTAAAMVLGAMREREREVHRSLLERRAPRTVERRVRAVVDEAFTRLERAFPELA
jgi:AcrR family transcriptional regulator